MRGHLARLIVRALLGSCVLFVVLAPAAQPLVASEDAQATSRSSLVLIDDNEDDEDQTLDEFVDEVTVAINEYWRSELRKMGRSYRDPKLVRAAYNQRVRSRCGNSRGSDHSYCPIEETVYVDWDSDDETSFESLWDDERYFVIVTTMGHEWGHHVQNLLGLFDDERDESGSAVTRARRSIAIELQADCLMGAFARSYARANDWVERVDLEDAMDDTEESGDDPDTPMRQRTHGTPKQRLDAFLQGYRASTPRTCGI